MALRAVERADLQTLTGWFSRYELQRTLSMHAIRPLGLDDETAWYEATRRATDSWTYAVDALDDPHAPDGRLIGTTSLMGVSTGSRAATFGISIADPAMRGKGYGGEVVDLMLAWGFGELNLNRIGLGAASFNQAAIKLYERKGFRHEGIRRDAIFREGRYWDEITMGILQREWAPKENT